MWIAAATFFEDYRSFLIQIEFQINQKIRKFETFLDYF
jgi:hypothetical protein